MAKISCESNSNNGEYNPTKFSMLTPETDKNGFFLATFTPEQLGTYLKPTDCKVYLESSPSYSCNVATNINLGKSGASLTHSNDVNEKTYILKSYSVQPLVYTSAEKCKKPTHYTSPVYPQSPSYKAVTYSPPVYTPKSSYKAPAYTPKSSYETPSYTPSAYVPASKTVTYSSPVYTPKSSYEAPPSYSPKSEYKTPTSTNYGY